MLHVLHRVFFLFIVSPFIFVDCIMFHIVWSVCQQGGSPEQIGFLQGGDYDFCLVQDTFVGEVL